MCNKYDNFFETLENSTDLAVRLSASENLSCVYDELRNLIHEVGDTVFDQTVDQVNSIYLFMDLSKSSYYAGATMLYARVPEDVKKSYRLSVAHTLLFSSSTWCDDVRTFCSLLNISLKRIFSALNQGSHRKQTQLILRELQNIDRLIVDHISLSWVGDEPLIDIRASRLSRAYSHISEYLDSVSGSVISLALYALWDCLEIERLLRLNFLGCEDECLLRSDAAFSLEVDVLVELWSLAGHYIPSAAFHWFETI